MYRLAATPILLQDLDGLDDTEALLAFGIYHAFDAPPPLTLILAVLQIENTDPAAALNFSGAGVWCNLLAWHQGNDFSDNPRR